MATKNKSQFNILYDDDYIVALDKPSGMLVSPDRWDKTKENLASLVHEHISPNFFNVHRIDRGTSGIVVFAKDKDTLRAIVAGFVTRQVSKTYIAIALGSPAEIDGEIDAPIAPDLDRLGSMRVSRLGKPSLTGYHVAERYRNGCALIELHPHTGRTHQLRVHLARIRCPIIADPLYGPGDSLKLSGIKRGYRGDLLEERPLLARLALHSSVLEFDHPALGSRLRIESPLPPDMELAIKYLRKYSATT